MSEVRDALEAAQARLKALSEEGVTAEQLEQLSSALEHEADAYAQLLSKAERRGAREQAGLGSRLVTTGFTILSVMPIVVMISASASRSLRYEREVAAGLIALGVLAITVILWPRWTRGFVHLVSGEWRLVRRARSMATVLSERRRGP